MRRFTLTAGLSAALALGLWPTEASAWGISPPVGPTGLAQRCSGTPHGADDLGPRWRLGASYGAFRTTLVFGEYQLALQQMAVSAALEWRASKAWSLQFALGGIFNGRLGDAATGPGGVASVGVSWLALEQGTWTPFLQLSGSLAFSVVQAAPTTYLAGDIRVALAAGYTFFDRLTPYLVARAFGGPVFFGGTVGTDLYHYQLGLGLVVGLPGGVDLSAELVPFGEQRVTAGVGVSF